MESREKEPRSKAERKAMVRALLASSTMVYSANVLAVQLQQLARRLLVAVHQGNCSRLEVVPEATRQSVSRMTLAVGYRSPLALAPVVKERT